MIDFLVVRPVFHHLGRQIVQSPAKGLPPGRRRVNRPTEVSDLYLACGWCRGRGGERRRKNRKRRGREEEKKRGREEEEDEKKRRGKVGEAD